MTELGYILKITRENSNSFSMIINSNTMFHYSVVSKQIVLETLASQSIPGKRC